MRKKLLILLCIILLAGCAVPDNAAVPDGPKSSLTVVASIFPIYDWVREIVGSETDHIELKLLLNAGVDLHSYQPSAKDIVSISTCDLFLYVGGESDAWVSDALQSSVNPGQTMMSLLDILGDRAKEEEHPEGMQEERSERQQGQEPEYDEHVWLSLKNASFFCAKIADTLAEIDPAHAEQYRKNAAAYMEKLSALDGQYASAVENASFRTLLFGDRFPFRYLADDYGLTYYAAFSGCSAETEASFETIVFLAGKLDELGLPAILQIESSNGSIPETIRSATKTKDQMILTLDSLQSVTAAEMRNGLTYLDRMASDLSVLKQALNGSEGE